MEATITQVPGKFPEPQFSNLQRAVFADVQRESAALAEVLSFERQTKGDSDKTTHSPMVRFGAYVDSELVGWSCGWVERGDCFYMANSGVIPSHQRRGIYSALLAAVLAHARDVGAQVVRSQHSVLNSRVIACKLKREFYIAGLSCSAQMGTLVELVHHISKPRFELFRARVIPHVEPSGMAHSPLDTSDEIRLNV